MGKFFSCKSGPTYCIIWIPLKELQIRVVQVLPAFHALGRGRLEEKCMIEKLHLDQNQGHQKCVINAGISAESNFENNILEYGINILKFI